MSFKGLFIKDVPADEKVVETKNSTSAPNSSASTIVASSIPINNPTIVTPQTDGAFDEKIYNNLHQSLNSNPHTGTDYSDFSKAKKALDTMAGMGDAAKYQAAFASLKATTNLSKETLLATIEQYFAILDKEQSEFDNAMKNAVVNTVTVNQKTIEAKKTEIQKNLTDIQKLNDNIAQKNVEINQLQSDVNTNQTKIDNATKNFAITINVVKNELTTDKGNINTYII